MTGVGQSSGVGLRAHQEEPRLQRRRVRPPDTEGRGWAQQKRPEGSLLLSWAISRGFPMSVAARRFRIGRGNRSSARSLASFASVIRRTSRALGGCWWNQSRMRRLHYEFEPSALATMTWRSTFRASSGRLSKTVVNPLAPAVGFCMGLVVATLVMVRRQRGNQ